MWKWRKKMRSYKKDVYCTLACQAEKVKTWAVSSEPSQNDQVCIGASESWQTVVLRLLVWWELVTGKKTFCRISWKSSRIVWKRKSPSPFYHSFLLHWRLRLLLKKSRVDFLVLGKASRPLWFCSRKFSNINWWKWILNVDWGTKKIKRIQFCSICWSPRWKVTEPFAFTFTHHLYMSHLSISFQDRKSVV